MATKKSKVTSQQMQQGAQITEAQKSLISLMGGVKQAGLGLSEAQFALQAFGADAGAALADLVARGFAFQMGNGLYALTRGADGRYAYESGAVPVQQPPPAPQPPPAQPPVPQVVEADDPDEEDMPYGSAFEQEMRDRLDAIDLVLRKIMTALGIPGGAPAQQPSPPMQPQQPLQQWGAPPPAQQQPTPPYQPMPPQAPMPPAQQPMPWDGMPQQQPPFMPPQAPQMQPSMPQPYPQQPMMPAGYGPPPTSPPNGYSQNPGVPPAGSYGYQTPGYPPRQ